MRERLIEILKTPIFPHEQVDPIEAVADYLIDSSVTVQKHGRWIDVPYVYFGAKRYMCDQCKDDDFWTRRIVTTKDNYCPNCGADMRGE